MFAVAGVGVPGVVTGRSSASGSGPGHVHVAVADPSTAVRRASRILRWTWKLGSACSGTPMLQTHGENAAPLRVLGRVALGLSDLSDVTQR